MSPAAAIAAEYSRAARDLDVDGLLALYHPDVVVYDLYGREPFIGLEAWRGQVELWLGSLDPQQVNTAEITGLGTWEAANLVVARGLARYSITDDDGAGKYGMTNRLTWVLQEQPDGGWLIVHEHTSAPADMETNALLLD